MITQINIVRYNTETLIVSLQAALRDSDARPITPGQRRALKAMLDKAKRFLRYCNSTEVKGGANETV